MLAWLRKRWGGGIRPSVSIDRDSLIERWDGQGEGRATCINFEAFGLTAFIIIGRTPPMDKTGEPQ